MTLPSTDEPAHEAAPGKHDLPRDMLFPALRTDPESFPVLKAFQDYIEEERERARKRIVTISAVSMLALVLVVMFFLGIGFILFGSLSRRNDQLQEIVLQAALRDLSERPPAAPDTPTGTPPEWLQLQESLRRLEAENSDLQHRVTSLQDLPSSVAARLESAISNLNVQAVHTPPPRPIALPPPAAAPFGPSTTLALPPPPEQDPPPGTELPAPPTTSDVASAPPSPSAAPPQARESASIPNPNARISIRLPSRIPEAPRIEGFVPCSLTLVTDRNVAIPWRIVIPE